MVWFFPNIGDRGSVDPGVAADRLTGLPESEVL